MATQGNRVGETIAGRYRLDDVLGSGGMGIVYRATHVLTEREVAVKLLDRTFAEDAGYTERFYREARAAVRLQHPNVVDVLDMGDSEDGGLYLALELLRGETLADRIKREKVLTPQQALKCLVPIMSAVAAAHRNGLVHRDLKPSNIFLSQDGEGRVTPKLLDFGIVKDLDVHKAGDLRTKTQAGMVLGTPHYMAPEQARGGELTPAADVWSMGVVLYRCLTGEVPFKGPNPVAIMFAICAGHFVPVHKLAPSIGRELSEIIDRALQVELPQRYPHMTAFLDALASVGRVTLSSDEARTIFQPDESSLGPFVPGTDDLEHVVTNKSIDSLEPATFRDGTKGADIGLIEDTRPTGPSLDGLVERGTMFDDETAPSGQQGRQPMAQPAAEATNLVSGAAPFVIPTIRGQPVSSPFVDQTFGATMGTGERPRPPKASKRRIVVIASGLAVLAGLTFAALVAVDELTKPQPLPETFVAQVDPATLEAIEATETEPEAAPTVALVEKTTPAPVAPAEAPTKPKVAPPVKLDRKARKQQAEAKKAQRDASAARRELIELGGTLAKRVVDSREMITEIERRLSRERSRAGIETLMKAEAEARKDAWVAATQKARCDEQVFKGGRWEAAQHNLISAANHYRQMEFDAAKGSFEEAALVVRALTEECKKEPTPPASMSAPVVAENRGATTPAVSSTSEELPTPEEAPPSEAASEVRMTPPEAEPAASTARGEPSTAPAEEEASQEPSAHAKAMSAYERGEQLRKGRQYRAAVDAYGRAIKAVPDFLVAFNSRGLARRELGDLAGAIADFSKAIELSPKDANLWNNRGLAQQAARALGKAEGDFSKAIELKPTEGLYHHHRGVVRMLSKSYQQAEADLTNALQRGHASPDTYFHRGVARAQLGLHRAAAEDFSKVLQSNSGQLEARYRRGVAYAEQKDYERAIVDFNAVIEKDPDHAASYLRRGLIYAEQNKKLEALRDLQKFLQLEPDSRHTAAVKKQIQRLSAL